MVADENLKRIVEQVNETAQRHAQEQLRRDVMRQHAEYLAKMAAPPYVIHDKWAKAVQEYKMDPEKELDERIMKLLNGTPMSALPVGGGMTTTATPKGPFPMHSPESLLWQKIQELEPRKKKYADRGEELNAEAGKAWAEAELIRGWQEDLKKAIKSLTGQDV